MTPLHDAYVRLDRAGYVRRMHRRPSLEWYVAVRAALGQHVRATLPPRAAAYWLWAMGTARDLDRCVTIPYEWGRGDWTNVRQASVWPRRDGWAVFIYHLGRRRRSDARGGTDDNFRPAR